MCQFKMFKFIYFIMTELQVMAAYQRSLFLSQMVAFLWSYCGKKLEYLKKNPSVQPDDHKLFHMSTGIKHWLQWWGARAFNSEPACQTASDKYLQRRNYDLQDNHNVITVTNLKYS